MMQNLQDLIAFLLRCFMNLGMMKLRWCFDEGWTKMMTSALPWQLNEDFMEDLALPELACSWLGIPLVMLAGNKGSCTVMGRPCWSHLVACLARIEVALGWLQCLPESMLSGVLEFNGLQSWSRSLMWQDQNLCHLWQGYR